MLLIIVSTLNFFLGVYIEKTANAKYRRLLLYVGLFQGIGALVFFKYYNFFIESLNETFHILHISWSLQTLNIIIPLGISFFTFRILSYLLDIDKGKIKATKDWVIFFNYISFFPSLLSGPIDKAQLLIPQLEQKRALNYDKAKDGLSQILYGLFKKIVIADNCAKISNHIFDNFELFSGSSLLFGTVLYTIQIYADFSGYSDMAVGFSRLIGFEITKNFSTPLFAQNIADFWRRWHISLTSWLTEYVFTPLSISLRDYGKSGLILAIILNFTICGLWHGANWTYVLFGFLHGCLFIPLILKGTMNKKKKTVHGKLIPTFNEFINIVMTFTLVALLFVLFRSESLVKAFGYYQSLFVGLFQKQSYVDTFNYIYWEIDFKLLLFCCVFMFVEWIGREREYAFAAIGLRWPMIIRWAFYYLIILSIIIFGGEEQQFIYFQF